MPDHSPAADEIKRTLRWLSIATVVLFLALAGGVVVNRHNSTTTTDALCALRADVERRIQNSERFLIEHPKGFAGIPAATIQKGLDDQRRTVIALSDLNC